MKDIEALKQQAEELKTKLDDVISKIEKAENNKEFDFFEWYGRMVSTIDAYNVVDVDIPLVNNDRDHIVWLYETKTEAKDAELRRQAEYIIRKTLEYYNKGWKPNWNDTGTYKYYFIFEDGIDIDSRLRRRMFPNWAYIKDCETAEKVRDILTNFHGVNVLKYWLIGEK